MTPATRLLKHRATWVWLPFVVAASALLVAPLPAPAEATTRHLTLQASQFEFAPGRVTVNHGDHVIITLEASDVVHGFYLDGYGIERRVEPGVAQRIEFVAGKAGKFRIRCSVGCGPLHPFMIGELVVAGNAPYWRAIGIIVLMAAGMLVSLWQTGRRQEFEEAMNGTQ